MKKKKAMLVCVDGCIGGVCVCVCLDWRTQAIFLEFSFQILGKGSYNVLKDWIYQGVL